jgi:hypothetical protein
MGQVEGMCLAEVYIRSTYQALVDAIIPPTGMCSGIEPTAGAVQLGVDRYVALDLDHSQFVPAGTGRKPMPLSWSTSQLLDVGALELLRRGMVRCPLNATCFPGGGWFAALARIDRLRALALLDRVEVPLHLLPPPFTNNPGMVQTIVDSFHQLTMFGYYSEWPGYGTTRLLPPECRRVEETSPAWGAVGYPGPAFGYRELRGFLLYYPHAEGGLPYG